MEENNIIAPRSDFQQRYLMSDARIIVAGGAMGCVPAETEYLSEDGWKKISEYEIGEKIYIPDSAQYNNRKGRYLKPIEFIKAPCEEFIKISNGKVNLTFSQAHKVVYFEEGSDKRCSLPAGVFIQKLLQGIVAFIPDGHGGRYRFDKESLCEAVESSDGYMYCFETYNNLLYLKQDNNKFITGNSSKSYIGLMRHLRYVHDGNYVGFCVRKNNTQLMSEGGLFWEAEELFRSYDPKLIVRLQRKTLEFSTGAVIGFDHYENDKAGENWRGRNVGNIMYDEATQADEKHIWTLISRLRRPSDGCTNSIWLTCNPDPDSYLFDWVKWWLYPEGHDKYGLPDPDKNGKRRYLVRLAGQVQWADSMEEAIELYGNPELEAGHPRQVKPFSFEVHLGNVFDNPVLLETSPEYLASLEALPEIDMRRNLLGDWTARATVSGMFKREWVEEIPIHVNKPSDRVVRAFDFAGSLKSAAYPYPDYTASVRMVRTEEGEYIVDDVIRDRIRYGDWEKFVLDCARRDPPNTHYIIPQDPNASARRATQMFVRDLLDKGLIVRTMKTDRGKMDRFRPFSAMAMNGGVKVLKNCARDLENGVEYDNKFYYDELERFDGVRRGGELGKDDKHTCRL